MKHRVTRAHAQRGLSLVELMVGATVGLVISAAGSAAALQQLSEHRRLTLEMHLQQDLRAAAELIQQDVRRAGFQGLPQAGQSANAYRPVTVSDDGRTVTYQYARSKDANTGAPQGHEHFGIRWASNTLYLMVGKPDGKPNWQPITDPELLRITHFQVRTVRQRLALDDFCDQPCTAQDCPAQTLERLEFSIRAEAVHTAKDAEPLARTHHFAEQIRADDISGRCPA